MRLNQKALAVGVGIVWGVLVFLITNIILLRGGTGEHMSRLSEIYVGYSFSFFGSIIGLLWGFVSMFIAGWVVAWLYNRLSGTSTSKAQSH